MEGEHQFAQPARIQTGDLRQVHRDLGEAGAGQLRDRRGQAAALGRRARRERAAQIEDRKSVV